MSEQNRLGAQFPPGRNPGLWTSMESVQGLSPTTQRICEERSRPAKLRPHGGKSTGTGCVNIFRVLDGVKSGYERNATAWEGQSRV